jgi:hypothetical protein
MDMRTKIASDVRSLRNSIDTIPKAYLARYGILERKQVVEYK